MKKILLIAAIALAVSAGQVKASHVSFGLSIGIPVAPVVVAPAPVVVAPAPVVYAAPAPVVYAAPAPVVYPAPVYPYPYCAGRVVVGYNGYYRGGYHPGYYHGGYYHGGYYRGGYYHGRR